MFKINTFCKTLRIAIEMFTMSKTLIKAKEIIDLIQKGETASNVKANIATNINEWYSYSNKAYNLLLDKAKVERKKKLKEGNVLAASNEEITDILSLNEKLANYALSIPSFSTTGEVDAIKSLSVGLPGTEAAIIDIIGKASLDARMRALQKKGRIEKFDYFKPFNRIIDAAIVSYYRTNFISCYLTLIPVIEGVIIRWMGYTESETKPEFEEIRKFFKNSAMRQPCPSNIQFHQVFVKACDMILNNHFYRPTNAGKSYSNFNRHVASHLLNDDHFATRENCIRLFILLDTMTEIYLYESKQADPRFYLTREEISIDVLNYNSVLLENVHITPENKILNTSRSDLGM